MDIAGFLPTRLGSAGEFASGARRAAAALLAVTACTFPGCGDSPAAPSPPTPPVTPPAVTATCPGDVSAASLDGQAVTVVFDAPTVAGGTAPFTTTCTPASASSFSPGQHTVNCAVRDAAGQTASCAFTVRVTAAPRLGATRFVAFGDSITEGVVSAPLPALLLTLTTSYPTRLTSLLQDRYLAQALDVFNAGVGGEQAAAALPRLQGVLSQRAPEVLLLLDGANDLMWWHAEVPGVRRTADAIEELVREGLRRNVRVFLATLPPWRAGSYRQLDPTLPALLNAEIDSIARKKGAVLVDLYAAMLPEIDTLIGRDGLHPTEAGYERIAQVFFEVIRATLEVPPPSGAPTVER